MIYLTGFTRINVNSTVGLFHVLGLPVILDMFGQFVFLFLQDGNSGL